PLVPPSGAASVISFLDPVVASRGYCARKVFEPLSRVARTRGPSEMRSAARDGIETRSTPAGRAWTAVACATSRGFDMNRRFLSKWDHSATLDPERITAFRNEIRISYIAIVGTLISILAFTVEGGIGLTGLLERT